MTITDLDNGCSATSDIQIFEDFTPPELHISPPEILTCINTVISLNGEGSSVGNEFLYEWTTNDGNILSGETTLNPMVDAPGVYNLLITDISNYCTVSGSAIVAEDIVPPTADAGQGYEFDCIHVELELNGVASVGSEFTYQWTTPNGNILLGATSLNPIVNLTGTYILSVTNQDNGCFSISETIVTEDTDVPHDAIFEIVPPLCYGDQNASISVLEVIGGEPPYEYSLDEQPFSEFSEFLYLSAGSYSLTIRDAAGCTFETTLVIQDPPEVMVELGENIYIELGESVVLQAQTNIPFAEIDSVSWFAQHELDCEDCLEQEVAPLESSAYSVMLSNTNGCITEDDIYVFVENKKRIFIPNAFSPDGDGINDIFMIYAGKGVEEVEQFQIFTRWGEMVFQKNNFQPNDPFFGWDGYFKGRIMNPAVFVFFAKIKYINGQSEIVKGDLFLK